MFHTLGALVFFDYFSIFFSSSDKTTSKKLSVPNTMSDQFVVDDDIDDEDEDDDDDDDLDDSDEDYDSYDDNSVVSSSKATLSSTKSTTTTTTTTTQTPTTTGSTTPDPYFTHFDPLEEHKAYKEAQMRLEELHREKVTKVCVKFSNFLIAISVCTHIGITSQL